MILLIELSALSGFLTSFMTRNGSFADILLFPFIVWIPLHLVLAVPSTSQFLISQLILNIFILCACHMTLKWLFFGYIAFVSHCCRDVRLVNWDCVLRTAVSDIEVCDGCT